MIQKLRPIAKQMPQTETKAETSFKAGVKEYRLTYYTPDYTPKVTDILAAFRISVSL